MGADYDSCACGNVARSDKNRDLLIEMSGVKPERYYLCEICQTTECYDVTPLEHMLAAHEELSNDQRRFCHGEIVGNQERFDALEATFRLMGPIEAMKWLGGLVAELLPSYHARTDATRTAQDLRSASPRRDAKRVRPAQERGRKRGSPARAARK